MSFFLFPFFGKILNGEMGFRVVEICKKIFFCTKLGNYGFFVLKNKKIINCFFNLKFIGIQSYFYRKVKILYSLMLYIY